MSTAMLNDDRPVDPDDELLVAYLDGELDRQARSSLEQRLLDEATLRGRLQELQRGWDLLDELPQATPNEKLVESTLEMVVSDMVGQPASRSSRWTRFRFPLAIAAASLLAALLAVGGVAWLRHARYQQQLRDLALAENHDAYAKGQDLQLMDQLHRNADWKQTIRQAAAVGSIQPQPAFQVAGTPLDQRAEQIQQLPADQRRTLAARWNRFARAPEPHREQLRTTAAAVDAQINSEQLLETMRQYAVWRETLPPELIDQIESDDPATREQAIERAIALTQQRIVGRSRSTLSEDAVLSIYEALEQILFDRIASAESAGESARLAEMREQVTDGRWAPVWLGRYLGLLRGPGSPDADDRDAAGEGGAEASGEADDGNDPATRDAEQDAAEQDRTDDADQSGPAGSMAQVFGPLTASEFDWVEFALPQPARDDLDSIALLSPLARELALRAWAEEAIHRQIRRQFPGRNQSEAAVLDRYHSLSPEDQEFFDLLPAAEWAEQLSPRRFPGRQPTR